MDAFSVQRAATGGDRPAAILGVADGFESGYSCRMPGLDQIPTPALVLDLDVLETNLANMQEKADRLGVALRPHLKTHKCVEIAQRQRNLGARGVTVSTLHEPARGRRTPIRKELVS